MENRLVFTSELFVWRSNTDFLSLANWNDSIDSSPAGNTSFDIFTASVFLPLIGHAMIVWVLILRGVALKEYYQTSGGIAAAVVIIPIFLWVVALMILIVFAFTLGVFA